MNKTDHENDWTLYYSETGLPYWYNSKTGYSIWANNNQHVSSFDSKSFYSTRNDENPSKLSKQEKRFDSLKSDQSSSFHRNSIHRIQKNDKEEKDSDDNSNTSNSDDSLNDSDFVQFLDSEIGQQVYEAEVDRVEKSIMRKLYTKEMKSSHGRYGLIGFFRNIASRFYLNSKRHEDLNNLSLSSSSSIGRNETKVAERQKRSGLQRRKHSTTNEIRDEFNALSSPLSSSSDSDDGNDDKDDQSLSSISSDDSDVQKISEPLLPQNWQQVILFLSTNIPFSAILNSISVWIRLIISNISFDSIKIWLWSFLSSFCQSSQTLSLAFTTWLFNTWQIILSMINGSEPLGIVLDRLAFEIVNTPENRDIPVVDTVDRIQNYQEEKKEVTIRSTEIIERIK